MPTITIFISYRRNDTLTQAGRLYDLLEKEFGTGSVFYDNEALHPGTRWPEALRQKVSSATVVLVLIANRTKWLGVDDEGLRRIDNAEDWVRQEVETGLSTRKLVIPVLFNEAKMPSSLPGTILPGLSSCQAVPVNEQFWSRDIRPLFDLLRQHFSAGKDAGTDGGSAAQQEGKSAKFGLHHQYTCDRSEQVSRFQEAKKMNGVERIHFFYLYGGELQSHPGIFHRFVDRLKGLDLDMLNAGRKAGFAVYDFSVGLARVEDLAYLNTELPRMIMADMGISEKEMEAIENKNLAFALQKSPVTAGAGKDDKICIHLIISEMIWDKEKVPAAARHFITNFCLKEFPADAPEIFFFFSIEYEDEDAHIKAELKEALAGSSYMTELGELMMVTEKDIKAWFRVYGNFWTTSRERDVVRLKEFGETHPEMYMEDVQPKLAKIIIQINDTEKDAHRNS